MLEYFLYVWWILNFFNRREYLHAVQQRKWNSPFEIGLTRVNSRVIKSMASIICKGNAELFRNLIHCIWNCVTAWRQCYPCMKRRHTYSHKVVRASHFSVFRKYSDLQKLIRDFMMNNWNTICSPLLIFWPSLAVWSQNWMHCVSVKSLLGAMCHSG